MRSGRLLVTMVLAGCAADAPPEITVGPVAFTENQVLGLTESRRESLALVTAFGLAVADSSTAALGAPLVGEWTDDRLLEILAAELTLEDHGVGEAALLSAYRADPEWELTVQHILVYSERWRAPSHREAAEAKAGRALELLGEGLDFSDAEARLAAEEGAEARAGVLPPGREGAWVPEFWAAALALQPGELSPVTETQYGFHVLRLEDRQEVPFPEARSAVARRVAGTLGSPAATLDAWMARAGADAEARRATALAEARARGLEVPPGELAEIRRRWEDQVAAWAPALGFIYGLTPGQVTEAALSALARTGQSADLARRDLVEHAELMRARYEIDLGTTAGGQS
jgi:hypothetical protein